MRNSFRTPLIVEVMEPGDTFKLQYAFTQRSKKYNRVIHVPRNFVTDFASIPRIASLIIAKLGRHTKASVIHDWLYQRHPIGFSRKLADDLFLDGMLDLGVKPWRAHLMYRAVRLSGWMAWRK